MNGELRPIDYNGHVPEPTNADLFRKLDEIQAKLDELIGRVPEPPVQLEFCAVFGCPGHEPATLYERCSS